MLIQTLLESPSGELREIARTLANECSEFLNNPILLLRGISGDEYIVKSPIRTDRKSRSQRNVGTVLFNAMVEEEFHIPNVRNRCHFITNSMHEAHKYGNPYLAFPVNGSRVLHNPAVSDSMNNIGDIWHMITSHLRDKLQPGDLEKIQQCIVELDKEGAKIEAFTQLVDSVSDSVSEQIMIDWDRAKQVIVGEYITSGSNAIPTYQYPVEYMLFDAEHTYLININNVAHELGTYDSGGAADTQRALIEYIKSI